MRRRVHTEHPPARPDPLGQRQRRLAATAADVEHPLAAGRRQRLHRARAEPLDQGVEPGLHLDPRIAGYGVPIGDLIGVGRLGHGQPPRLR
jgi:hypothetical protein